MSDKEKSIAEKAKEWYSSRKGRDSLKKSIEKAVEESKKFKMCRQIPPEVLRRPFTI